MGMLPIPVKFLEMGVCDMLQALDAPVKPAPRHNRGYGHLFLQHVEQAPKGCDFDFLKTSFGSVTGEPEIH
jgi:dihydroxy-acid dehydratase